MKNLFVRGRSFAALTALAFGASTLLTGCFDKEDNANPKGSTCNTAATVVDQSGTLVLQLADGSTVVPTGSTWTEFKATAGETVTVGYYSGKGGCSSHPSSSADKSVTVGCITATTPATTTVGPN